MTKPRTATSLLAINGSLKHDPAKYAHRINEPKPEPALGDAPAHFSDEQVAGWHEIKDMVPAGRTHES